MCERMRRWNVKPNLVGKGASLPPVSAELWERISSLFKVKPLVIKDKTAYIPEGWLPHLDQLSNPVFLSAVGLCPYMPRGNVSILPTLHCLIKIALMSLFVFSDEAMGKLDDASKGQVDMPSWLAKVLDASTYKAWKRQQAAEQAISEQMAPPPAEEKKTRKVATDAAPTSKRRAGGTGKSVFKSVTSKASKGFAVPKAASASPSLEKTGGTTDPLAGIPEVVRRNIPLKTAERARNSGGKFYSNIVTTCRSSSSSSLVSPRDSKAVVFPIEIPDPQTDIDAELDQIPSSGGFNSHDRRKIMTLMRNAIPPQYAETLPEAAENMLAAMQSSALDMFILLDSLKKWRTALVHEEARHRLLASQCGDQHFAAVEKFRFDRREQIDAVTTALASRNAENTARLLHIDQNFSEMEDLSKKIKEKEAEFSRLETQFKELEVQLEAASKEVASSQSVLDQLAMLGEKSIRRGMELAWNAEFASERPFSWFEKFLTYQIEVEKAQKEGRTPLEFVPSEDEE
ncbi:uncharacterized protein [Spinacia oleracea]|uniref:Aminotransferase-like plant mobile domain-containing protein n=1 Tax=Spinacia oleracea TaxID=3562 RepID=A0ABM3QIA5_SPIOL|nr:uncharacterized protein LOC130459637 [Spinacia oleracea]